MTIPQLLKLLEYTFWANDRIITTLQETSPIPEDALKLMNHIFSAHRIWLTRITGTGKLPSVWGEADASNWEGINIELYHETTDIVKSSDFLKMVTYRNSKGELYENTIIDIIYHVINHSTHHRAQVARIMREKGMKPPPTDLIFYLRS